MNIDSLRECVYLARTLSFTQTAQHFYITQPVLSRHIANVEGELGFQVFLRGKNGVHLTNAGRIFAEKSRILIEQYDDALEEIERVRSGGEVPIDLGYLYGASSKILPKALKAFGKEHPAIDVRYLSMEIDEIPAALDDNRIDIAITSDLEKFEADRFAWVELYRDSLCLIAPKAHHLASKKSVTINDLAGEEIIVPRSTFMPTESDYIRQLLSPILETVTQRKLIGDLNSIRMALMVEGCAAIEFAHLKNYYSEDEFAFVPLEASLPEFNVVAVWKRASETVALLDLAAELERQCCRL